MGETPEFLALESRARVEGGLGDRSLRGVYLLLVGLELLPPLRSPATRSLNVRL